MVKKFRFRIVSYSEGDASYYETLVKTWFGWVPFSVFYKTDIVHVLSDPSVYKTLAYERINQYCNVKGYKKKDIEIVEIGKKERNGIFIRRLNQIKRNIESYIRRFILHILVTIRTQIKK